MLCLSMDESQGRLHSVLAKDERASMAATEKASNRWLGLLGAAVIVSSIGVCAYSDSSSECITGETGLCRICVRRRLQKASGKPPEDREKK